MILKKKITWWFLSRFSAVTTSRAELSVLTNSFTEDNQFNRFFELFMKICCPTALSKRDLLSKALFLTFCHKI